MAGRTRPRAGGRAQRQEQAPAIPATPRRARWELVALFVALAALYALTACPTIFSGDAPELAAAGATFGVPHPPGYPLYCLVANLWSRALPVGDVGWRLNLLSALAAAGAASLLGALLLRLGVGVAGALFGALSLALGATCWSQALISEVYAFDLLLGALALHFAGRARERRSVGAAVATAVLAGLWFGHRTVNVLYLPALLLLGWPALAGRLARPRVFLALLGAGAATLLVFAYLPLASRAQPLLDAGDPETWSRLWEHVTARVYRRYLLAGSVPAHLGQLFAGLPRELGVALLLAPVGAVLGWRRARGPTAALLYLVAANLAFAAVYHVPDAQVFVLPALLGLAALAGLAAHALLSHLPPRAGACALVALPVGLGAVNFGQNDLRGQTLARDFARDALDPAEPGAIVLTHVDSVSFGLWYVQAVERRRQDLLVLSRGRAVSWYQQQVQRQRPELALPSYEGPDAAIAWPALILERNAERTPVYVTADLAGFFGPSASAALRERYVELPAGLMTRLAPAARAPAPSVVVARNRAFWRAAWPHAVAARERVLETEQAALLLHYGSLRVLFARYALRHGEAAAAREAAEAVVALKVGPVLDAVNRVYRRQGHQYHMSRMPELAAGLAALATALEKGEVSLTAVRSQLEGPSPEGVPPPAPGAAPGPRSSGPLSVAESPAEEQNREGIARAQRGDLHGALAAFEAAVRRDPRHGGALFNRARALTSLGRLEEARQSYRALLVHHPAHVPALLGLGELLARDRPSEAQALYRRALAAPVDASLRTVLEERLEALGRAAAAAGAKAGPARADAPR
ncbi:MAG: DUF2723 domain-containing protein [Deltaproteobacteria bacterium]|nr:DUF2723 domain-containing protein [Deltaproteobacteria bacterium]